MKASSACRASPFRDNITFLARRGDGSWVWSRVGCIAMWGRGYISLTPLPVTSYPQPGYILNLNTPAPVSTREVHPMLLECWPSVADDGPAFQQHCVNVSCWLGAGLFFTNILHLLHYHIRYFFSSICYQSSSNIFQ